jgi:hypothetical protein
MMFNVPLRYTLTFIFLICGMAAWQVFLIQRDNKLFKAYDARMEQIRQLENQ